MDCCNTFLFDVALACQDILATKLPETTLGIRNKITWAHTCRITGVINVSHPIPIRSSYQHWEVHRITETSARNGGEFASPMSDFGYHDIQLIEKTCYMIEFNTY